MKNILKNMTFVLIALISIPLIGSWGSNSLSSKFFSDRLKKFTGIVSRAPGQPIDAQQAKIEAAAIKYGNLLKDNPSKPELDEAVYLIVEQNPEVRAAIVEFLTAYNEQIMSKK